MILQLHEGIAPEEAKKQLVALLTKIPYNEVVEVEQELINEGYKQTRSNPQRALELFQAAYDIAQSPRAAAEIGNLHIYYLVPNNVPLGLEWLTKAASGNDFGAYNNLARFHTTYEDSQYRNVTKGIQYGELAVEMNPHYDVISMLAMAYAQDGQFKQAVEYQTSAITSIIRVTIRREKVPIHHASMN